MARSGRKVHRRLDAALKELGGVQGKVGYTEGRAYADGTPIAYVAAIQELGFAPGGIPPRPTLGPAVEANADKYRDQFAGGARAILRGEQTATTVMEAVMLGAAGDVREAISQLTDPPLRPDTIRRKGSSKPLIETGQMIQAVTGVAE